MKKKVILTEDNYEPLRDMLSSSNLADRNVAYSIIENCDINKSMVIILLALKTGANGLSLLENEYTILYKKINKICKPKVNTNSILFNEIYNISKEMNNIHMGLILELFKEHIIRIVGPFNKHMINDLEFTLKLKENG